MNTENLDSNLMVENPADFDVWFAEKLERQIEPARRIASARFGVIGDDVVQWACLRAWQNRHQYNTEKAFSPWFLRVVINTGNDLRRKETRKNKHFLSMDDFEHNWPAPKVDAQSCPDLLGLINGLEGNTRNIFLLRFFLQHSFDEISRILGLRSDAVRKNYSRASNNISNKMQMLDDGVLKIDRVSADKLLGEAWALAANEHRKAC